jgi:hypothetical protein
MLSGLIGPRVSGDVRDLEAGHERRDVARADLHRWFSTVYPQGDCVGDPWRTRAGAARIEELIATGANHLLLNPVCRYAEQLEALAEVVGLCEPGGCRSIQSHAKNLLSSLDA